MPSFEDDEIDKAARMLTNERLPYMAFEDSDVFD
jgi:hypothetical protein